MFGRRRRTPRWVLVEIANLVLQDWPAMEIVRHVSYLELHGRKALSSNGIACAVLIEPSCGDDYCVNPEHQVLEFQEHHGGDHESE